MTHLLISADISIFSLEISKFCYIKKYRYRLHFDAEVQILLTFLQSLNIFLIILLIILILSTKMATPCLLKITVFWNKGCDVIISANDVTVIILWHDSNYIVEVFMWPKFGNSSISMGKAIRTSILYGFDRKATFFEGCSWFKFNNSWLLLGANLKFYTSVGKGLKLKVRKFWGLIPTYFMITLF